LSRPVCRQSAVLEEGGATFDFSPAPAGLHIVDFCLAVAARSGILVGHLHPPPTEDWQL
jgi:hypothetical protein